MFIESLDILAIKIYFALSKRSKINNLKANNNNVI